MPLLLQFQSQTQQQSYQPGNVNVVVPNPALDRQAAENLIGDMIAESLRSLSTYLEANAAQHAGLESCVPIVTQAAHMFAVRDYAQAFNLIWLTYRTIETIRAGDPRVPLLRQAPTDQAQQTQSSVH